jgi:hypothetical protein
VNELGVLATGIGVMYKTLRLARRVAGCAVVALGLSAGQTAVARSSGLSATRVVIDQQPPYGNPASLHAVSCPTVSLCVAVDHAGNVVTSTDPTGGSRAWHTTNVDGANNFTGVSCPSASLCIATDESGNVVASTKPAGGSRDWTVTHADDPTNSLDGRYPSSFLSGVACPSTSVCVAVDDRGNVVTSTNPTGGPRAWITTDVDGANYLSGVSCASPSLCVAVDLSGNVVTSTNPTGGAGTWLATSIAGVGALTGVYPRSMIGGFLSGVSCQSTSLCVATDNRGNVVTSATPTEGERGWSTSHVDATGGLTAVSCPSISLCVVADQHGTIVTSLNPTGGAGSWNSARVDSTRPLSGLSCPTVSLCVAVDLAGNIMTSTHPSDGAWRATNYVASGRNLACFGAAARDARHPCYNRSLTSTVIPTPSEGQITPNAPCTVVEYIDVMHVCTFGVAPSSAVGTIALLGDSHAQHWRAALEVVTQANGWQGVSVTGSGCPFSEGPLRLSGPRRAYCRRMNQDAFDWLAKQPEISTVFVSESELSVPRGRHWLAANVAGYIKAWDALPASIEHIIVIRDTPRIRGNTLSCVEQQAHARHDAGRACAVPRRIALEADPAAEAAVRLRSPRAQVLDMTGYFCDGRACYPEVGGALVYKDFQHITEVFSTTLGPFLLRRLNDLMTSWM